MKPISAPLPPTVLKAELSEGAITEIARLVREAVREELRDARVTHEPEMLTVDQAAAKVRSHPDTIRNWIKDGSLKASKPGRKWLISPEDLDARIAHRPAGEVNIAALVKETIHGRR